MFVLTLPSGETYKIETVEDLLNCPTNMEAELIQVLYDFFIERRELIKKTGKEQVAKNILLSLTNGGVNKSYIDMHRSKHKK